MKHQLRKKTRYTISGLMSTITYVRQAVNQLMVYLQSF